MKTEPQQSRANCERHPRLPAERTISGIPMCSQCVILETGNGRQNSAKKSVARRRRNQSLRSSPIQDYSQWEAFFLAELQKRKYRGISEILHRNDVAPHVGELFSRVFQHCTASRDASEKTATLRTAAKKAATSLQRAARELQPVRDLAAVQAQWYSYVLDSIVRNPSTASKAGRWMLPNSRDRRSRIEPEELEDEAHDLTALVTALASINKSVVKQGDGHGAPVLVYLHLYLEKLVAKRIAARSFPSCWTLVLPRPAHALDPNPN